MRETCRAEAWSPARGSQSKAVGLKHRTATRARVSRKPPGRRRRPAPASSGGAATERAELEQRVARLTAELHESRDHVESFTATLTHDLRAPLRAAQGFAQALLEDFGPRLEPEARDFATRIAAAAALMDRMILDLMEYSRIGRSTTKPGPVSLDTRVAEALELLDADIRGRNAEIRVEGRLPAVLGQPSILTSVLTRLISNAVKFVEPGARPSVVIRAEERAGTVRLWIEDRGIGLAPGVRERIFQPFERLHGREAYPGTGLGLAIVRRGIERMGGNAGVESQPGRGSRFWIELKRAKEAA